MTETNIMGSKLFILSLLALSAGAHAFDGTIKDPTVPPAVWLEAHPEKMDPAAAQSASGNAARAQVIVVGKTRRLALVDGRVVEAGDALNGSKVVAIKADKVVTEDAANSLAVTPDVEKKAPGRVTGRKKSVVIPEVGVSSKANVGSNQ